MAAIAGIHTRDINAYRRRQKTAEIEKAAQIRKCYEEWLPSQIKNAREMMKCQGGPVSTIHAGRGVSCLTALGEVGK